MDDAVEYAQLLARARPYLRPLPPADGAGYGQVAVTGDAWLRARAERYLRGLPELLLDDDAMVDALVLALEELDAELAGELRAWDPGKHPRGPGGRFRSTVDVLKEAIQKHRAGGGKGDPFDGYDREQLRKVARARGIELKRGEGRDSIAAKLLADLGGPSSPATSRKPKASAPKVNAPPPLSTKNPPHLSGNGMMWWYLLKEDTGRDAPIPIRNLTVSGYTIRSGKAYRVDGISILVEDGTTPGEQVVDDFLEIHRKLPPEADTYQQGYAWLAGRNPDDVYWEQRYNISGFRSFATAGDGGVRIWGRANNPLGPKYDEDKLFHEFGHNVSSAMAARGLNDRGAAWEKAAEDDVGVTRPTDLAWVGPLLPKAKYIRFDYQSGKGYPRGVSEYGKSSVAEDYAESMAFYLGGRIGAGRFTPGGPMKPVYFRDLFPNRAAVFDQVFPEIAQRQLAAIKNR